MRILNGVLIKRIKSILGNIYEENEDGSVIIFSDEKMIKKYFPDDGSTVGYDEYRECLKGMFEPIADHMGATITMEHNDSLMITTITKK